MPDPLSPDPLRKMHAYWRASNYISVGQNGDMQLERNSYTKKSFGQRFATIPGIERRRDSSPYLLNGHLLRSAGGRQFSGSPS
jgi:hypothetical protein